MSAADLAELCRSCGLCCDGTLFTFVRLEPTEAVSARRSGLVVLRRDDGSDALAQRCSALSGCDCTVYEARPGPCRRYECLLLGSLREGEVSLGEAKLVVDGARERVAAGTAGEYLKKHFLGRSGTLRGEG